MFTVIENKFKLSILLSGLFCFSLNIFINNNFYTATLNTILFLTSITFIFIQRKNITNLNPFFLIFLAFVPLFSFAHARPILYLFLMSSILFWLVAIKLPKAKTLFALLGIILFFWASLISNKILNYPPGLNKDGLIWNNSETNRLLNLQEEGALFIPFRIRPILFGNVVYVNTFFTQIANLITLKNLYDTLLLVNIYPLILGIQLAYKRRADLINKFTYTGISLAMVAAGINISPDRFNCLFVTTPLLTYLIILGFTKINGKVYVILLIFSIILANASGL